MLVPECEVLARTKCASVLPCKALRSVEKDGAPVQGSADGATDDARLHAAAAAVAHEADEALVRAQLGLAPHPHGLVQTSHSSGFLRPNIHPTLPGGCCFHCHSPLAMVQLQWVQGSEELPLLWLPRLVGVAAGSAQA
eukprot:1156677-Pelagomonas_calceolata.AAC.8